MKKLFSILAAVLFAGSVHAEVVLKFGDPETFTDFEYAQTRRTISTDFFSREVLVYLEKSVMKAFPEGAVLTLEFLDIDLAGGFEPWQSIPLDDVRFFKSRYPPVLVFSYHLADDDGNVLAEGVKRLRVLGYQDRFSRRSAAHQTFYYERRILESWIKRDLVKQVSAEG